MKTRRIIQVASVAAIAALAMTGCAANEAGSSDSSASGSSLSGTLNGIGSSAQGAAQTAWQSGFQTTNSGVTVNYDPQGSGAGVTQFTAGAADFAGSDAYLDDDELKATFVGCASGATPVEVPNYISPIAVVFNVKGVDSLNLSASTIAQIFQGKITKWNDAAIAKENSGVTLPDATINTVHRSDDSGTTFNFTDYLHQAASSDWKAEGNKVWSVKVGDGAKGTPGVATAVKNGTNTIGYIDESAAGDLNVAKLKVGDSYVAPSADAAAKVVAESKVASGRADNDLAIDINRTTTASDEYPLVLVSYLIGCSEYKDSAKGALVKAYFGYTTSEAGQEVAAKSAGSAPLSTELSKKVAAAVATIK